VSGVVVAVAVAERNVGRFAVPGQRRRPFDRHPHPSVSNIRRKSGKTRRPVPSGCKAVAWVCFVLFVLLYCGGVILPQNCCMFICIFDLVKNYLWPSIARGLNSDTTERVFCLTYY